MRCWAAHVKHSVAMFRRINITGNAGAGKTSLASEIGTLLDIPTYGLDSILWEPGWKEPGPDERRHLIQELVAKDTWVIDGVSRIIRKEADLVIFLDVPRRTCLYRCVKRNWRYMFRSRPGLPDHCCPVRLSVTVSLCKKHPFFKAACLNSSCFVS